MNSSVSLPRCSMTRLLLKTHTLTHMYTPDCQLDKQHVAGKLKGSVVPQDDATWRLLQGFLQPSSEPICEVIERVRRCPGLTRDHRHQLDERTRQGATYVAGAYAASIGRPARGGLSWAVRRLREDGCSSEGPATRRALRLLAGRLRSIVPCEKVEAAPRRCRPPLSPRAASGGVLSCQPSCGSPREQKHVQNDEQGPGLPRLIYDTRADAWRGPHSTRRGAPPTADRRPPTPGMAQRAWDH